MTIFGVDIARYQAGLDLNRVWSEGFRFCVAKIGQGAGSGERSYGRSLDPEWPRFRDTGRPLFGNLFAGYWYVGDDESAASQAARCRDAIGDPSIPIMLDHEDASGTYRNAIAVRDAMRAIGLRVRLLYLPRWYWQRIGSPSMVDADMALVSSRYPSTRQAYAGVLYEGVTASHWSGYGGLVPTILQFASSGLVAGQVVDVNAFEGSMDRLRAVFGARIVVQDKGNTVVISEEDSVMPQQFYGPASTPTPVTVQVPDPDREWTLRVVSPGPGTTTISGVYVRGDKGPGPRPGEELARYQGFSLTTDDTPAFKVPRGATHATVVYQSTVGLSVALF